MFDDRASRRRRPGGRRETSRPKRAGELVADVIRLRGYATAESDRQLQQAWQRSLSDAGVPLTIQEDCRVGRVSRGRLDVFVSHSLIHQDLRLFAEQIVTALSRRLPEREIRDLRIRVGNRET